MGEATWAPTPATPTMATLQKWVCGYVGFPDDDEALETALAGIRQAIAKINTRDWNWAIVYEDMVSDATLVDYAVPSNFRKPYRLLAVDADGLTKFRLAYVPWKSFLDEYQEQTASGDPCVYTVANMREYGTVSLDCTPRAEWVARYPTLRIWYYRNVQNDNQDGQPDWPGFATPFVQSWAEGYTADRYAVTKASAAYAKAERHWHDMVRDDNNTETDWS